MWLMEIGMKWNPKGYDGFDLPTKRDWDSHSTQLYC